MNNIRLYFFVFVVIVGTILSQGCTSKNQQNQLKFSITSELITDSKYKLRIKLISHSKFPVEFSAHFFHTTLFKIKAIGVDSKKELFQIRELGGHGKIRIPPRGMYSRKLELNQLFPEIINESKKQNILITWNAKVKIREIGGKEFYVYADDTEMISRRRESNSGHPGKTNDSHDLVLIINPFVGH